MMARYLRRFSPPVLAGVVGLILTLAACAPAAPVEQQEAQAPTPAPEVDCAQGEAPLGDPMTWTFEERLRCFPPPAPPGTPPPLETDPSKVAPESRWVMIAGDRINLPQGVRLESTAMVNCAAGERCPSLVITLSKGNSRISVSATEGVVVGGEVDPADPTAFDFLAPYVRRPGLILPEGGTATTAPWVSGS